MKIPLNIEKSDRITLTSLVRCPKLNIRVSVKFIIDTGSPYTFLGMDDVLRQNRLLQNLTAKTQAVMGGGKVNINVVPFQTIIHVKGEDGKIKDLEFSDFAVSDKASLKAYSVYGSPSIIGIDFFRENNFDLFISTKDNIAYLEKRD